MGKYTYIILATLLLCTGCANNAAGLSGVGGSKSAGVVASNDRKFENTDRPLNAEFSNEIIMYYQNY